MKRFLALFALALPLGFASMASACPEGKGGGRGGPMKELDKDGDERLSLDEVKDKPRLQENFGEIDTDKDGQLTREELKAHRRAHKAHGGKGEKPLPAD